MAKGERSEPNIFEFFVGNVRFCLIFRYNMSLCWLILYQQNSKFTGKILNVPTNCKIRGFQPLIQGGRAERYSHPHIFYLRWEGCPWLSILKGDLNPIYDSARPNFRFSFFFLTFCGGGGRTDILFFETWISCWSIEYFASTIDVLVLETLVMIVHNHYLYWSETYGNLYNIMIDERSRKFCTYCVWNI